MGYPFSITNRVLTLNCPRYEDEPQQTPHDTCHRSIVIWQIEFQVCHLLRPRRQQSRPILYVYACLQCNTPSPHSAAKERRWKKKTKKKQKKKGKKAKYGFLQAVVRPGLVEAKRKNNNNHNNNNMRGMRRCLRGLSIWEKGHLISLATFLYSFLFLAFLPLPCQRETEIPRKTLLLLP